MKSQSYHYSTFLLFLFACCTLLSSEVFGQCTLPTNNGQAANQPGAPFANDASCPVSTDPVTTVPVPTITCPTTKVTYNTPELGIEGAFIQYWNECVSAMNTPLNNGPDAVYNGYISQLFCDLDPVYGLPTAPATIAPDMFSGVTTFVPTSDNGNGGSAATSILNLPGLPATCDNTTTPLMELVQIDYWLVLPASQPTVSFAIGGNSVTLESTSIFIGEDLNSMCEVAYEEGGNAINTGAGQQPTGTYSLADIPVTCGSKIVRVRIYVTDISNAYNVAVDINIGNGFVGLSSLPGLPVIAATSGDDNTVPTIPQITAIGFQDANDNIFDLDGNYLNSACIDANAAPLADKDNDGVADFCDLDDDNDGILDTDEGTGDTDGDGISNHLDLDSDNDGIPDAIEACGNIGLTLDQCSLDFDGDGGYTTMNTDSCPSPTGEVDLAQCYGTPKDTDGDNIPDFLDLDSDGDGCADNLEALTDGFDTSMNTYLPGDGIITATTTDDCGLLLNTISGTCPIPIDDGWIDTPTIEAIGCPAGISLVGADETVITVANTGYVYSATPVYINNFPATSFTTEFDVLCASGDPAFGVCSYSITYQDLITAIAGCNLTIERTFSLITNCNTSTCTQIISVSADCNTAGATMIQACDDGIACTINDMETILVCDQSVCVPCAGVEVDCTTPDETMTQTCDDGIPCTINDTETILTCDGSVCVPCMGEVATPPIPTLICPTEFDACAGSTFNFMFADGNPATAAQGSEANPIIGGPDANVVSNAGIIASGLSVGTYTFTLNYESPAGCFGTPVSCTFTVVNSKSADAGSLSGGN